MKPYRTDQELAEQVKQFMAEHPYCSRTELRTALNCNVERLKRMESEGLIKLPLRMNQSIGASKGAARNKMAGRVFTI